MPFIPPEPFNYDPQPTPHAPAHPSPHAPIPAPVLQQRQLTADQEMELLLVPESMHAQVCAILLAPTPVLDTTDWMRPPITTVEQAYQFLQAQGAHAIVVNRLAEIEAQDPKIAQAEFDAAEAEKKHRTALAAQKPGFHANNRYIAACQNRKAEIARIKSERAAVKVSLRAGKVSADPAFEAWATEQRKACEAWIASKRPIGLAEDAGSLALRLASLDAQLDAVLKALPLREDFV